jgi:hypothetical protein
VEVPLFDTRRLRRTLSTTLEDWRGVLTRQTPHARQALQALLDGRIVFAPEVAQEAHYVFEGRIIVGRLISGAVEAGTFNSGGASTGFEPVFELRPRFR